MRLIEKDYYTLGEVVAAWEMPRHDAMYLAETGRMRLSVRLCRTHIERGFWKLVEGQGWAKVPEERARYTGLVDLKEQDAHLIFRDGGTERLRAMSGSTSARTMAPSMYSAAISPTA